MENQRKITSRQLMVTAFIALLSPFIRILPRSSVNLAGHTAWLSGIPALILGLGYVCLITGFLKRSRQGDSLMTLCDRALGRLGGAVFLTVTLLWLLLYAGFIARSASERLLSTVYQGGKASVFVAAMLIASVLAAMGSVQNLVRTAEVFLPIIGAVLVFVILASIKDMDTSYLLPVTYRDIGSILLGSIPILDVIGALVYFLFLSGSLSDRENLTKKACRSLIVTLIAVFGVMVVTIGFCAPELTLMFQNAFFMVIRNISVFGIIERIEALIIGVWILTDFVLLTSLVMIVSEIFCHIFGIKKSPLVTAVLGAVIGAAAMLAFSDAFTLAVASDLYVPVVNIVFSYILMPLVLIVGGIREKNRIKGD